MSGLSATGYIRLWTEIHLSLREGRIYRRSGRRRFHAGLVLWGFFSVMKGGVNYGLQRVTHTKKDMLKCNRLCEMRRRNT